MMVRITPTGANIELTHGDAVELLEQLGRVRGKDCPKVRVLHSDLQKAIWSREQGAKGYGAPVGLRSGK